MILVAAAALLSIRVNRTTPGLQLAKAALKMRRFPGAVPAAIYLSLKDYILWQLPACARAQGLH